jgi:hypothetical protein
MKGAIPCFTLYPSPFTLLRDQPSFLSDFHDPDAAFGGPEASDLSFNATFSTTDEGLFL